MSSKKNPRLADEVGAVGDIGAFKEEVLSDKDRGEKSYEPKPSLDPAGFRERVEAIQREEQARFEQLSKEEQDKIEPMNLPAIEKNRRLEAQFQKEMKQVQAGTWDSRQTEFISSESWKRLGIDRETAARYRSELEQAKIRKIMQDAEAERNQPIEEPPILKKIREERAAKERAKQEEIERIFLEEQRLAEEGDWESLKSRFFSKFDEKSVFGYKTLESINQKAKAEKKDAEETAQAQRGEWVNYRSHFYGKKSGDNQEAERLEALRKLNEEAIYDKHYLKEEKQAKEGKWMSSSSFFVVKKGFGDERAAKRHEELNKINQEAADRVKQEKEKKTVRERYVSEAKRARQGEWNSGTSYFRGKESGENDKAERFAELNKINEEAKTRKAQSKKEESRERASRNTHENSGQKPSDEEIALRQLGLKEKGFTAEDLKGAYRKFVKEYHPDQFVRLNLTPQEQKRRENVFKEVSPGYESLIKKLAK